MADDSKKIIEDLNKELGFLEEQLTSIADKLSSSIKDTLEDIKGEADGVGKIFSRNLTKSINSIAKDSITFLKNSQKIYDGSAKTRDIQKEIEKLSQKRLSVERNIEILTRQGLLTETEKQQAVFELNEAYQIQNSLLTDQLSLATEIENQYNEVNKKLGIFGGLLKGIGRIPILKDLVDTKSALEAAQKTTQETGSGLKGLKSGMGDLVSQFKGGMANSANLYLAAITLLVDAIKLADEATGDLAKNFNISYDEATNLRNELIEIGNDSGNIALTAKSLQESMVAIGQALGTNSRLNKADLETFTELREMAGYTNEELIGIQKLTLATGGNLKNNTKQFLGTVSALNAQNKLIVNEKQLLKEVANTSAAIKLSVGGTTEGLAKSAFQAKQFGINLEQADKIASNLLDFESSISNELSAELITGKDLNLEKARLLALNGDIAGSSAEILKQVGGTAEFTKMNRIQQESLAKAVGMSREELAASLIEREALSKIGAKDAESAKAEFDMLVSKYGYEQAVSQMGDKQYANQLKQQSIQERMNKTIEKMKEIFISIAEPILQILSPLMDIATTILPPILKILQPIFGVFKAIAAVISGIIKMLTGDFEAGINSFKSIADINWFGGPDESESNSSPSPAFAKGGIITKPITNATIGEAGAEAVIPLNSPSANKYLNQSNPTNNLNLSVIVDELKSLKQEVSKLASRPVIIDNNIDGTKFGTSIAMNTYKTQ